MILRSEYPRPNFKREKWFTLNGEWEFEFDDDKSGESRKLFDGKTKLNTKITVPFSYQYSLSGIDNKDIHKTLWYRRAFNIEDISKRILLCFNGVSYSCEVWINGYHVISHAGAYAPFNADITPFVNKGENIIVVKTVDEYDLSLPRGKQSWTGKQFACWYYANAGIWQSVWIEFFGDDMINSYSIVPDIDNGEITGEIETLYGVADELSIIVTRNNLLVNKTTVALRGKSGKYVVDMYDRDTLGKLALWTPENPLLYNAEFVLYKDGNVVDKATTRFGMRKISIDSKGQICLNNNPYYQRLILDQGYWVESGTTPPSVDALKKDIELCKQMGFNGARKHQKLEDPYWYYLADELGFLTWCEMPSAYEFCEREIFAYVKEWTEIVSTAKNYTSVIAYVPLNESWGVWQILNDKRQQQLSSAMYHIAKAVDGTRLVSTNDGWENTDETDFISIHDYAYDDAEFKKKYIDGDINAIYPAGRKLLVEGANYKGQPILFTEFGGIAMQSNSGGSNWGYGESAQDEKAFYPRLDKLVKGVYNCPFQGYCYTQVSDVQQEVNGLLDENHNPKFDLKTIYEIFTQKK